MKSVLNWEKMGTGLIPKAFLAICSEIMKALLGCCCLEG